MANDKLFRKRKAKGKADLRRKKAKRSSYDRVLIVCEGEKTEPIYLTDFKDCLRLNSANIEIDGSCGSSPISVFDHAKRRYLEENRKANPYDRVFCVFDKDTHGDSYEKALKEIRSTKPNGVFKAIPSIPCFEFFLLLHFEYTTKPFIAKGKKSVCDCVVQDLQKYVSKYGKGSFGLFEATHDKLPVALERCKKAIISARKTGTDNPTTKMHELIEYLDSLASG